MTFAARSIVLVFAVLLLPAARAAAVPPPPRREPPPQQPAPGPDPLCSDDLLPDRVEIRFRGTWVDDDGYDFSYVLHLTRRGTSVQGHFVWTLRVSGTGFLADRIGDSALEYVRGTLDPTSCILRFEGHRITDASLIAADRYVVALSSDGALSGRTRGHGRQLWTPRITGRRSR